MAKFEALYFDVKKLDQCSVHLYADGTEITNKSSFNDLGIIFTNKLKWDSHTNQRMMKAQQKLSFMKRNIPFSTNTRVNVSLYKITFHQFPFSRQMFGSRIGKLQKTRKDSKTSAQMGIQEIFNR